MSKRMRAILGVLVIISLVSIGAAVRFFMVERQTFEKFLEVKRTLSQEKARMERELSASEAEASRLKLQVETLAHLRTQLEEEREALLKGVDNMVPRLVELEKKIEDLESEPFLANLLKEKALLEVEAKVLKENLKSKEAELTKEVRAKNKLISELGKAKIEDQVAEALSRDLARAKRDKFVAIETLGKLEGENRDLQQRMAQLAKIKASLGEKLLVADSQLQRTREERDRLAEELVSVRLVLREREEEVDQVKAKLAKTIEETKEIAGGRAASIELPPIVVKAAMAPGGKTPAPLPQGRIVTINDEYKFVVIDLGKEQGVEAGMPFTVYRGDKEIGQVEVIEAHQRISAADIKKVKERTNIKVNDVVVPTR